MITSLSISNLKCFGQLDLELSNLSLLVGTNSSGKSTVIQSLLLLAQNISQSANNPLNGDVVSIGTFQEARSFNTNAKEIVIKTSSLNENLILTISEDDNSQTVKTIQSKNSSIQEKFNKINGRLTYLSANRIGSKDIYLKNYSSDHLLGYLGEYSIDVFEKKKSNILRDQLIKYKESNTFSAQVNYWLKLIVGCELSTEDIVGTDGIKAKYSQSNSRFVRPRNTGSGISYLISILIACLSAKENDLVIIENPEIHLHPKAQAKLMDFFVFISKANVQLIIETHSDHLFNGIRRNLKMNQLNPLHVSVNFFNYDFTSSETRHKKINFSSAGAILNHEKDLFDQFDSDLDSILGI